MVNISLLGIPKIQMCNLYANYISVYRILTKSITLTSLVDKLYRKNFDETTLKSLISNLCTKRKSKNFVNLVKKVFAVIFNHCNRLAHKKPFIVNIS